jgi:DNA-binding transcriptional ArsR family regulator
MARCPAKPKLSTRPLLTRRQAQTLESTFKMLANGMRLRMLHELARAGEICVGELAAAIGMKPQAVSNQLQRLAASWRLGATVPRYGIRCRSLHGRDILTRRPVETIGPDNALLSAS